MKAARAPTVVESGWAREMLQQLEGLSQYEENWDSHGGLPLQDDSRRHASDLVAILEPVELPTPAVVLGSGGTVQFEWRRAGRELEMEVLTTGDISYLKVSPDGQIVEGRIPLVRMREVTSLANWLLSQ